jgi:hypothetical protein
MEKLLGDTIRSIEEVIEKQKVIYDGLLSRAETDEQKESLNKLIGISNSISEAVKNKDIKALNNLLTELTDANTTNK